MWVWRPEKYARWPSSTLYLSPLGPVLNQKLTILAWLAGQQDLGNNLSLHSKRWGFRHAKPYLAFYIGVEDLNSGLHVSHASTLTPELSL